MSGGRELAAIRPDAVATFSVADVKQMAAAAAASGLYRALGGPDAAFTLMMLAQAEGLHPVQALRQYDVIDGKPSKKADAILADFMAKGGKVKWLQHDHEACRATFSAPGLEGPVTVSWTLEDAKRAKLAHKNTWQTYPRQMLRARVISEGARMAMPGVVVGIYTPEEVADFDDKPVAGVPYPLDGEERPKQPVFTAGTENAPPREVIRDGGFVDPDEEDARLTSELTAPVPVYEPSTGEQVRMEAGITSEQNKKIHALLRDVRNQYTEKQYHDHLKKAFCKGHTNELSIREASKVIEGLLRRQAKVKPELDAQAKEQEKVLMAAAAADLREIVGTIGSALPASWFEDRFTVGPSALTVEQIRTAITLLLCWQTPADYEAQLAKARAAGRCK